MCTYLAKRGATYYFRRPVPDELRPYLDGRREWTLSLRTKDRETAKRAIPAHTVATDKQIDAARAAMVAICPEGASTAASGNAGKIEAGLLQASLEAANLAAAEAARREAEYEAREPLRLRWERAARKSTAELTPDEAAVRDILRDVNHRLSVAEARLLSERVGRMEDRRGLRPPVTAEARPAPVASLPLLEVFDAYTKESGMRATTAAEWKGNLRALIAFIGHDDAARLTVEDVDRWRDALLAETTKRGKPRSARTVRDKYIATLRATLNYAISKRRLNENVAAQVGVRVPRGVKLRERSFSADEARAILSASMQPPEEGLSPYAARARRWIPWLCAYSGARVNELSQLRGSDVVQQDGIWTVRITPEAGTVKSGEARTVPLHPHLVEQGFPAVAQVAGEGPLFYDPARVRRPGPGNRHIKKVGEGLAAWVRETAGITDPNVQPNHGWRHTFKTLAIEAGMPERVADAIQGHAPRSVGQSYGSVSLQARAEAIAKLPRFPGP